MIASGGSAVSIVTGGSSAAGREVACALAGQGDAVALVYLGDQASAEATVEAILATGGTAIGVRADTTDALDVERLFTETTAMFGDVDLLVHTTAGRTAVLYEHAARRLRRGAAIVAVPEDEPLTAALAEHLHERGITIGRGHDAAELLAAVARRRPPPGVHWRAPSTRGGRHA